MSQTSYAIEAGRATAGMLGDTGHDMYHVSRAAEDTAIGFGLGVIQGTDPETQAKLATATGGTFLGVTLHQHALQDESADGFVEDEVMTVMRKGRVWVQTNEAVAAGDDVFFVYTGADAGKFRNDLTNADQVSAGAEFLAYDSGTGLALLSLNLPA